MTQITLEQAMQLAIQRHQAGGLDDAEKIYRQILVLQPQNPQALRLLGVIARQRGQFDLAIDLIQKSIAMYPLSPEVHTNLGDALRDQGQLNAAIAAYSRAVELKPDWPEAHGALGNAFREAGKPEQAIAAFSSAIRLKPDLPEAYLNLGNVFCEQGKSDQAVAAYLKTIQLKPDLPQAHNNLGNVLWDQGKLDEALAAYSKAIELRPGYPEAHWSKGKILAKRGELIPALACFHQAVQLNPDNGPAHLNLARMLAKAGRRDDAIAAYRRALQLQPGASDWAFELAALTGDRSVHSVPSSYVQKLFDGYAPNFDKHLVQDLACRIPQHLLEAVLAAAPGRSFDIMDLGCGTGLCGEQFRPRARHLAGVDLSPAMISAARLRGIYDQLQTGQLLPALDASPDRYDLILAGDVLVYVGDLSRLMPAVARSLRPSGLFAFSIEHCDGPGYFLQPHERFAHSMQYIRAQAAAAGLREISARQRPLRKQRDAETPGWIVVLAK